MKKTDHKEKAGSDSSIKKIQTGILLIFTVVSFIAVIGVAMVIFHQARQTILSKSSELVSADSQQLELNIDQFLKNAEKNATLLFGDKDYYQYDATDTSISDYDRIQIEDKISNRIIDISLMENYSDFGIIYANNQTTGSFSTTTSTLFPDGNAYETYASYLGDNQKEDAWIFNLMGNKDRFYYIKRLNPNAILVTSFFSRELDSVVEFPSELEDMTILLADDSGQIIYSSDNSQIGEMVPQDMKTISMEGKRTSVITSDKLINSNACENGWRVYTYISRNAILRDTKNIQIATFVIAFAAAFLIVGIGMILIRRMTSTVGSMVLTLEEQATLDPLTGTWNKSAFHDLVQKRMDANPESFHIFLMIDMDNFKNVNDTLGHKKGDDVISRFGALLKNSLGKPYEVGRIGGDEFAVYGEYTSDREDIRALIQTDLELLDSAFRQEFSPEIASCQTSLSIGVYYSQTAGETFEDLYEKADQALYSAKRTGKDRSVFYGEEHA